MNHGNKAFSAEEAIREKHRIVKRMRDFEHQLSAYVGLLSGLHREELELAVGRCLDLRNSVKDETERKGHALKSTVIALYLQGRENRHFTFDNTMRNTILSDPTCLTAYASQKVSQQEALFDQRCKERDDIFEAESAAYRRLLRRWKHSLRQVPLHKRWINYMLGSASRPSKPTKGPVPPPLTHSQIEREIESEGEKQQEYLVWRIATCPFKDVPIDVDLITPDVVARMASQSP